MVTSTIIHTHCMIGTFKIVGMLIIKNKHAYLHKTFPFVLCLLSISIALSSTTCADGWYSFEKNCYKFSNQSLSLIDSHNWCTSKSSTLVSISSNEENEFIGNIDSGDDKWIGLTKINGTWQWINEAEQSSYRNWGVYQNPHSSCAIISSAGNNFWHPTSCNYSMRFVCEADVITTLPTTTDRDDSTATTNTMIRGYRGCFKDVTSDRAMPYGYFYSNNMEIDVCRQHCYYQGYPYAGLEFSRECFCDDDTYDVHGIRTESSCNMACVGNSGEICGGPDRLSVYSSGPDTTTIPVQPKTRRESTTIELTTLQLTTSEEPTTSPTEVDTTALPEQQKTTQEKTTIEFIRSTLECPTGENNIITTTILINPGNTDDKADISEEIANLAKNVTEENVEYVAVELERITNAKVESEGLIPAEINEISYALESIAQVESTDPKVTDAVVDIVGMVLASDSSQSDLPPSTTASILESFEQQISTIATDGQDYTKNEHTLSVRTISFDPNDVQSDVVFLVNQNDKMTDVCVDEECRPINAKLESITIPKAILSFTIGQMTSTSFVSYYNPGLFQSAMSNFKISDVVLSATIHDTNIPDVFDEAVTLVFTTPVNMSKMKASCMFWNKSLNEFGDWSSNGCKLTETDEDGSITCACTHLTNFAVLFFPNDVAPGVERFLDLVTYIGCGMSLMCLTLTIVTILFSKKLRTSQPQIIMMNLCVALFCLYLIFIFGIGLADQGTTACKVVAIFVHYFLLSSIAWTAVEATNMYYLVIKVFDSPKSTFMWIGAALAWDATKYH
ncbi:adhesion G-protein coupled receptor G2-like [Anneissia japonica]|uniref:adhesion G-protein coupled receptor G2-like n=1 Tax=Anneissia japonica TaxID=1529436 RepID=UPI001425956C|nr:adhesion G-protein coupled receptor G2-like [Anneissia japonica]